MGGGTDWSRAGQAVYAFRARPAATPPPVVHIHLQCRQQLELVLKHAGRGCRRVSLAGIDELAAHKRLGQQAGDLLWRRVSVGM